MWSVVFSSFGLLLTAVLSWDLSPPTFLGSSNFIALTGTHCTVSDTAPETLFQIASFLLLLRPRVGKGRIEDVCAVPAQEQLFLPRQVVPKYVHILI